MPRSFSTTGTTIVDTAADIPTASAAYEGVMVFQKDTNELKICDGSSWISMLNTGNNPMAAWTSYNPTISQGSATNISKTMAYAGYITLGKLVICSANISLTGTGQANNAIKATLPVPKTIGVYHEIGYGSYFAAAGAKYELLVSDDASTSVVRFQYAHRTDDLNLGGGGNFTSAVANGHVLSFTAIYEAA
jgi:hypothetical protein